jgi:hypothetical protein
LLQNCFGKGYGLRLLEGQFLHQDVSKLLLSIFFHRNNNYHFLWICSQQGSNAYTSTLRYCFTRVS